MRVASIGTLARTKMWPVTIWTHNAKFVDVNGPLNSQFVGDLGEKEICIVLTEFPDPAAPGNNEIRVLTKSGIGWVYCGALEHA